MCAEWSSKFGLRNHERTVHEGTKPVSHRGGRKNPWNRGLTQATDARITGHSEATRNLCRQLALGRIHTPATKAKISRAAVKNQLGGHTSKLRLAYQTVHGPVVQLQSSYEIQVATALDAAGVRWTRPAPLLWLDETGTGHRYYPDFYLPEHGVHLDPKNSYLQQKDRTKLAAVSQ